MQNYFPVPARYRLSTVVGDEGEWGARLVGVFFIVLGALTILRPALSALRPGTALLFGVLGIPAMVTRIADPLVTAAIGGLLLATGLGIVLRKGWAHWLGMVLALVLFVPAMPYITLAGLLIIFALWRGRPQRGRKRAST